MTLDDFTVNAGYFFLFLNTILFLLSFKGKEKSSTYFIMYLILCSIIQLYSNYLFELKENNLFLSHYFFTGQFIILNLFFLEIFQFKKIKKIVLFITVVLPLCFIIYFIKNENAYRAFSELEIALTSIPLLIYSFYFFTQKIESNNDKKYIYFNSGFFIYTLCSTLIFVLGNIGSRELKLYVWDINQFLYLIFQILIFVEWYKNFKKQFIFNRKMIK